MDSLASTLAIGLLKITWFDSEAIEELWESKYESLKILNY